MLVPNFSTVIAIDLAHFKEFQLASLTWKKWRPEIWQNPMLVFVDTAPPPRGESCGWWRRKIERCIDHPNMQVIGWPDVPGATQRHRMLSAFVYGAAEHVKTPYLLKLDTDTLCLPCPPQSRWHQDWMDKRKNYCYVSGSWGYTRGIPMWRQLLEWAKTVPEFQGKPEVPGVIDEAKNAVRHQRIISFFFWAQTSFIKTVASLHPGPLMPIASQDTLCFYVATRLGLPRGACRIKKFGLFHGSRGMEKRVKQILEVA